MSFASEGNVTALFSVNAPAKKTSTNGFDSATMRDKDRSSSFDDSFAKASNRTREKAPKVRKVDNARDSAPAAKEVPAKTAREGKPDHAKPIDATNKVAADTSQQNNEPVAEDTVAEAQVSTDAKPNKAHCSDVNLSFIPVVDSTESASPNTVSSESTASATAVTTLDEQLQTSKTPLTLTEQNLTVTNTGVTPLESPQASSQQATITDGVAVISSSTPDVLNTASTAALTDQVATTSSKPVENITTSIKPELNTVETTALAADKTLASEAMPALDSSTEGKSNLLNAHPVLAEHKTSDALKTAEPTLVKPEEVKAAINLNGNSEPAAKVDAAKLSAVEVSDTSTKPGTILVNTNLATNKLTDEAISFNNALDSQAHELEAAVAKTEKGSALKAEGLSAQNTFSASQLATSGRVAVPVTVKFGSQTWPNAVAERSANLVLQNVQSAQLQLDPPELGPLTVKIQVQHDQAAVSFVATNPAVKEALDNTMVRLRELLEEQGMQLVDASVSDQSQQGDSQSQSHSPKSRHANTEISSSEAHYAPITVASGIDYFV